MTVMLTSLQEVLVAQAKKEGYEPKLLELSLSFFKKIVS